MAMAFAIASLSRAKKLQARMLDKLQIKVKRKGRGPQSGAHQLAIARMWASLGYGKIKEVRLN